METKFRYATHPDGSINPYPLANEYFADDTEPNGGFFISRTRGADDPYETLEGMLYKRIDEPNKVDKAFRTIKTAWLVGLIGGAIYLGFSRDGDHDENTPEAVPIASPSPLAPKATPVFDVIMPAMPRSPQAT